MENMMRKIWFILLMGLLSVVSAGTILVLDFEGTVDPPMATYITRGIDRANLENAEAVLIVMDTPGGLLSATKSIVQKILNSRVPIIVYVYPSGSRAASAGAFIVIASHVAAMAPGTRIGAAHPVGIGMFSDTSAVMREKVTQDAAAWIRSIAKLRGRNVSVAQEFVLSSQSITASEALKLGVIDTMAKSIDELLQMLEGKVVTVNDEPDTLHTARANIVEIKMPPQQKFLHKILDPNIAYLLLMLGLLGIAIELQHPGAVVPGVVGVISILCAMYAFQILPVNYVGVLLIIAGIIMFILEVKMPGFGVLFTGGLVSILFGSFMLTASNEPALRIDWWTIIPVVAFFSVLFLFIVTKAVLIHRKPPKTGMEGLVGEMGEVIEHISPKKTGRIFVHGEIWNARSNQNIKRGEKVKVIGVKGLVLEVEKVEE